MGKQTFKVTALAAGIATALGAAPSSFAQEDQIEEITVTGSHIRRTEYEGRAPIQIVDQETFELIGAAQPVEVLKALTVNSGSQFYNETNNRAGVSQFNIRNLGLGSTLTLINGKRAGIAAVADDTGTDFVDINQFPLAMIQRIEVLTNGASATYGSQAVAGVANIITRKGMEGFEVSGGYAASEIEAWHVNMAAGSQFDKGGFNIYMTYYEQDYQSRSELPWLEDRLNGAGNPGRSRFLSGTGSPGSVDLATLGLNGEATSVAGAVRTPDPDCEAAGGVIGDPADTGLNPNTCRYNFADQVSVIAAEERAQVFSEFDWEFNDKVKYYAEASFSSNIIKTKNGGQLLDTGRATGGGTTVLPSHPFNFFIEDPLTPGGLTYIDPQNWDPAIHTAATLRSIHRPLGASVTNTALTEEDRREIDYTRIMNGMEFALPGDWYLDVSYMWAKAQRTTSDPSQIRSDTYQDMVRSGAWNPFGTRISNPGLISPKGPLATANCFNVDLGACTAGNSLTSRELWNQHSVSTASASEKVVDLIAAGELFEMGSSSVAMAVGAQFRDVEYLAYPDSIGSAAEGGGSSTSGSVTGRQDVLAFFAEAVIPLGDIGEVQLAVRNEDYGGGVSTTDPKISVEFGLGENVGVRASWGTSFQAPTVRQVGRATSSGFVDDPASATGPGGSSACLNQGVSNNINVVVAGAPGLSPQEAENLSAGIVFTTDRFRSSLDYFYFDYTDLIAAEAGFQAIVEAQCAGIEDTGLPIIEDPRVTRDATSQVREVRSQFTNIGSVETSGLDLNADYTFDIGNGSLILDFGATYLLAFDVDSDGDGTKEFDGVGSRNFTNSFSTMPELRANGGATWFTGNHTARIGFNYIDGYFNDQGGTDINSWETVDVMYAYTFSGLIGEGDTTLSIGANNVTDQDPPALYQGDANGVREDRFNANGTYNRGWIDRPGYDDRAGHDLRGTVVYVRFKHVF
ncbi:MAG: iron complex outermembrane receptor protein [Woeseiaceae bacterium]|jgi:iron complex outermembrane receptor protein